MESKYERLLEQYKDVSDERLKEILSSDEYTKDARRAACDIILERGVTINLNDYSNFDTEIEEKDEKSGSTVGEIIKGVSWILLISSVILSIVCCSIYDFKYKILLCLFEICASFIVFLFMYAVGEICCSLADIKENTKR